MSLGTGVRVVATEKAYTQGNMQQTGNSLDVAVNGRGFFQVLLPDGTMGYTRDGNFEVNHRANSSRRAAIACSRASQFPMARRASPSARTVSLRFKAPGESAPTQIGSLQLVDFINPSGLQPKGENILVESASSGSPQTGTPGLNGLGYIEQGSLEASNVNVVEELVNMIETQRAYEMNSKAISTTDQMLSYLTNQL